MARDGTTRWSTRGDGRRGAVALEFALFLPILLLVTLVAFDLGNRAFWQLQVEFAARAGVQAAMTNGWDPPAIQDAVEKAGFTDFGGNAPAPCNDNAGSDSIVCEYACEEDPDPVDFQTDKNGCGGSAFGWTRVTARTEYDPILLGDIRLGSIQLFGGDTMQLRSRQMVRVK